MQAQKKFENESLLVCGGYNTSGKNIRNLQEFLAKQCRRSLQNFKCFLQNISNPVQLINFNTWKKQARLLKRIAKAFRQQQAQVSFMNYLIKCSKVYFPNYVTIYDQSKFDQIIKISKNLSMCRPENLSDQRSILFYLQTKYDPKFQKQLIEKINSEVLIDKKNWSFTSLRINKFNKDFIAKNFGSFLPQLQRLLIRSASNVQVWSQFFTCFESVEGLQPYILTAIKAIKVILLNEPDNSLKIVKALTSRVKSADSFKQVFTFINSLIAGEHQNKKKIIFVQMLNGLITSVETCYNDGANIIFCALINLLGKFVDEDDFKIIYNMLQRLFGFVVVNDQIVDALKLHLKATNKYTLVGIAVIASRMFTQEAYEKNDKVKQFYNHWKGQFNTLVKKIETSWQWLTHIIGFLAHVDAAYLDHISQQLPIFKKIVSQLENFQKQAFIKLIVQKIKREQQLQQQIPQYMINVLCFLLENTRQKGSWKQLDNLSNQWKIKIITDAIYPSLWFQSPAPYKKTSPYVSLALYLVKKIKFIPLDHAHIEKILGTLNFLSVSYKTVNEINQVNIQATLKRGLYNFYNDEVYFPNKQHVLLTQKLAISALDYNYSKYIDTCMQILLKRENCLGNFDILNKFKEDLKKQVLAHDKSLEQYKTMLQQRDFYVEKKLIKRKHYAIDLTIRMMSQEEVKHQKLQLHLEQMRYYYERLFKLAQLSNNKQLLRTIFDRYFHKLIEINHFAGHRLSLYSFLHKLCSDFKGKKDTAGFLFYRYSEFISQFFIDKSADMTPSIKLMQKCQKFLKIILDINLSQQKEICQYQRIFINEITQYLLENMQYDIGLKKMAIAYFNKTLNQKHDIDANKVYTLLVKNLNIISSTHEVKDVLQYCISKINKQRYTEMFEDILNYVPLTRKLVLQVISKLPKYQPQFEDYIKLRILALEESENIQKLAANILDKGQSHAKSITKFNMKQFIQKNSKDTIEKLIQFIKQCMTHELATPIFQMVLKTSKQLFDEGLDQQGLQFFPYFLTLNLQFIKPQFFKPIFDLLLCFSSQPEQLATLSALSVEIGIDIIKRFAPKNSIELLQVLQSYINKVKGVSNIIFLGVLAPFLKNNSNVQIVEKRIMQLFEGNHQAEQKAISKCMPDLMSFFKQPLKKIQTILSTIHESKNPVGQAYLLTGLLKGIAGKQIFKRLEAILVQDFTKAKNDKIARLWILYGFVQNFGRAVEPHAQKIIDLVIHYAADNNEDVRDLAKKVGQIVIIKMSSYTVKKILPHLLTGLQNEQNWRNKICYIWMLGIMANSSARQLQTSLPIIVPTLSACLSNAHPTIRDKASEALSLIGQTIKNPQISNSIDILIDALQNPFEKSQKALQILLKTRFNHFIDPPSLSIVIPIIDYCLRGRQSELKAGACQIMGSICELIQNSYDLLPYLKIINAGLKITLCDPLAQIRSITSKAIGCISAKIGIQAAQKNFHFVEQVIQNQTSNTTQKHGAAQAYSEIICSQDFEYFETSLNKIFEKLGEVKHSQKQGFILIFLYVPGIRTQQFQGFIKQVNQNMYGFVSDQDQNLRNSAMQVQKVLINNYCLTHTDLLLQPLCSGVFQSNWRKRNAALILIGQMLNLIKSHMYNNRGDSQKHYAYYRGLMAVYILKDDELQMPRATANHVWNTYIQNTPKTIKVGLRQLIKMWTRFTHSANGIVFKNIVGFSSKYGQNYFFQVLQLLQQYLDDPIYRKGVFDVLSEFIKRLTQQFLSKQSYKVSIRQFYRKYILTAKKQVRESLARSMSIYVEKMKQETFFEEMIYPQIDKMQTVTEDDKVYVHNLHLIRDFLHTNSRIIVDRLIKKILELPLFDFKIEVITNNSDRVANYLYTLFSTPATKVILEEIQNLAQQSKQQNRMKLLVYCLNQVSSHLNSKYKTLYMNMLIDRIRFYNDKQNKKQNLKIIETILEMILFFLNAISLDEVDNLQYLISTVSALLRSQGKIVDLVHKVFLLLISDPKGIKTSIYYTQILVSLQNNAQGIEIWSNQQIAQNYVTFFVKGIAYGSSSVLNESLKMIEFMLNATTKQIMDKLILRIVGPIIRVTNYPLLSIEKINLLNFLHKIYEKKYQIEVYHNQILSSCLRVLQQLRNNNDIQDVVSLTLMDLMKNSQHKEIIVKNLLARVKHCNDNIVKCFYYVMKQMIITEPEMLPKTIYNNIHKQLFNLLNSPQNKSSIKVQYYISKTVARIGVYLNQHISIYETQIDGFACSYETMLHYLNFSYYSKNKVGKIRKLQLFIKQSSRDKVYYLLKSIKLCKKVNQQTKNTYSDKYIKQMVPEALSGFEEIKDILEDFEIEQQ